MTNVDKVWTSINRFYKQSKRVPNNPEIVLLTGLSVSAITNAKALLVKNGLIRVNLSRKSYVIIGTYGQDKV